MTLAMVVKIWSVEASEKVVYGYPPVQSFRFTLYDLEVCIAVR